MSADVAARLYLDIDGCICPFGRPDPAWGETVQAAVFVEYDDGRTATYDVRWSPTLILAIDELRERFDLELVWLSSWNEADVVRRFLVRELHGLTEGRLHLFDPDAGLTRYPDAPSIEVIEALLHRAELQARTGADAAPDLAAARALLAEHQLGAEAEQALTLAVQAELTTERQNEMGKSGDESDSP